MGVPPRIYHCFIAAIICICGPMLLFAIQQQQAELKEQHWHNELMEHFPDTDAEQSRSIVSPQLLEKTLTTFFQRPVYDPALTYRCDPMGSSCNCLEDWTGDQPICKSLEEEFKDPSASSRPKVTVKIEPNWEYINRYEPGMYDCPNSLCNVELANTDKFTNCVFVSLKRRDILNFSTVERKDCSFPILKIKLPSCVEVQDPRTFLASKGVRPGMQVVELHGIPIFEFKDLEMAERSLRKSPRPSNVVFCDRSQVPANEEENSQDVFIFSGDKVGKGWELQRPFAPQQHVTGLRAAVILENFERWHPTRQSYLDRLGELYLNETDMILGYKPIFDDPMRRHDWVPLFYPDVSLQAFRVPALPAKDRIHAVAWFSSECSPDYAPERYHMTNKLLELLPKSLPLHSFGKCKHNMNQFDFKECNGIGYDSLIPDRDATKECILRQYKFYIAFENSAAEGYITEKLWQGLKIGSLPIYWGSPHIGRYLPTSLDSKYPPLVHVRDFKDMEAVVAHIVALSQDDERYDKHMAWRSEPFAQGFVKTVQSGRSRMFCNVCDHVAKKKELGQSRVEI